MLAITIMEFMFTELWRYSASDPSPYQPIYRTINAVEACFWFGFCIAVCIRYARHRKSILEIGYAIAFLLFGLSDVAEMFVVTPALIAAKAVVLVVLLLLRYILIKWYYIGSRW
jgi:hypothetical protein